MQIVTTHNNTDFDALASMVAATILYPGAIPVLPKNINPNVKAFVSIHKDVLNMYSPKEIDFDKVKSLIVVDINSWARLAHVDELRKRSDLEIIVWDHHSDNGDINSVQKYYDEMGANITLMIRQLRKERKILTPIQATLFLTGLYEDTGNLTFPSTKPEDASAASYLLDNKADLNVLNRFLRPAYGRKQKDILFEMIKSSKRTKVNGYKICVNKLDIKGHVGIISRRDFRKVRKDSQLKAPVKAFMSTNITSVKPGESPMKVAQLMVKHDIGRLPVVDGDRVIGIITRSDVMHYFYDTLQD